MSTFRTRTWQTKNGPKTAWLVDYHHDGKRKFETFKTEKDARARLHEIEGERKAGTHIPTRDSIKLDEACNLWLENKQYVRKVERSTLKGYVDHVENFIKPKLGHHRLAKLTAPMIDQFYTQLVRSHSSTHAAKVMVSLRGVLKRAMTAGLIGQNVASAVEVHRNTRDKEKLKAGTHFPSKEEVNAIIEHARGHWRPFFVTAIYTGMRASEMRALSGRRSISTGRRSP
jgi:integrase